MSSSLIYKNKCSVPGCDDKFSKRHRFPKHLKYFKEWLAKIKNPQLNTEETINVYTNRFVCNIHFENKYIVTGTKRGLSRDAVPTLYLPEETTEISRTEVDIPSSEVAHKDLPDDEGRKNQPLLSMDSSGVVEPGPSMSSSIIQEVFPTEMEVKQNPNKRNKILASINVTRQTMLTPKCKKLYSMVCNWNRRHARSQHSMTNIRKRLVFAEKAAPNFASLLESVNTSTYTFIMQQIRLQKVKRKARRFTLNEKILSLTLLKAGGRAYRLLSKIFCLPSCKTLTNLLNKLPLRSGINPQLLETLKYTVSQLSANDRLCAVVFDEMSLSPLLSYNQKLDCIEGLEDFGLCRTTHIATYANVFLVKGICRQWKQPFCFTFSRGPVKGNTLKSMIIEVIKACQSIGLEVVCTICDQGSANQSALRSLLIETEQEYRKSQSQNTNFGFVVNGKEIVPLYDVPHLFKGIRNNLLSKNLHFEQNEIKKVAKWDHVIQFYMLDTLDDERLCPKLSDQHVLPGKMKKMKVSYMTQVFSSTVGSLMKRISKWDINSPYKLDAKATDTADFILFIDALFDSLNASKISAPYGKPLKGAVTKTSHHEQFWQNAIRLLNTMRFFDSKKEKFIQVPSLINLVKTLKGLIYLKNTLLKRKAFQYLLTRALNQDSLENFFGNIRSHGARNVSPDVSHFISSFKALIVNNFMSTHSPGMNCEEDSGTVALNNLKTFLIGESISEIPAVDNYASYDSSKDFAHIQVKKSRISKSVIAYISGFVVKKALQLSNQCVHCKNNLTYVPLEIIEARQYRLCTLHKPGSYLYFVITQSISRLFYLIPRCCNLLNLKRHLKFILCKYINFSILNCEKHDLGGKVVDIITRCIIYFWCKRSNKILTGKDIKFVQSMQGKTQSTSLLDPVRVEAHQIYLNKWKYKKKYKA